MTPNLQDVPAAVQSGNAVRLAFTAEQKQALRDPDGRLARDVLRHLLGARATSAHPEAALEFSPLTALAFQAVARKLGESTNPGRSTNHAPGIKRCRTMILRLRAAGILGGPGPTASGTTASWSPCFGSPPVSLRLGRGVLSAGPGLSSGRRSR